MGGGGQSSGQPYDELGGQYASFSGGTPPSDQFNWGTMGQGLQRAGGAYAQSASQPSYMGGVQYPASPNNPASVPNTLIPQSQGTNEDTQALLDALRRIESASSARSNVIMPEQGAAKYWYVDPRAVGVNPNDMGNLGLLPEGAQPSF